MTLTSSVHSSGTTRNIFVAHRGGIHRLETSMLAMDDRDDKIDEQMFNSHFLDRGPACALRNRAPVVVSSTLDQRFRKVHLRHHLKLAIIRRLLLPLTEQVLSSNEKYEITKISPPVRYHQRYPLWRARYVDEQ
jgi:hypothetical protein